MQELPRELLAQEHFSGLVFQRTLLGKATPEDFFFFFFFFFGVCVCVLGVPRVGGKSEL